MKELQNSKIVPISIELVRDLLRCQELAQKNVERERRKLSREAMKIADRIIGLNEDGKGEG